MSGYSNSQDCPECSGKDSLKTYGDSKPYDTVGGMCLECGFSYDTKETQMTLDEVNFQRKVYDLEPLTQLTSRCPKPKINNK